jgi:Bacterial PH domain
VAVSAGLEAAGERQVYRSGAALAAWWAWAVFALAALAVIAVRHHDHGAAVAVAVVVTITGVVYGCAFRPRVVAAPAGISVCNPVRTHRIPWGAVTQVKAAPALRVHYAGPPGSGPERVVYSWALPSSPRADTRRELRARRRLRSPGTARGAQVAPGYARLPEDVRAATQGSAAQFAARQLSERARREQQPLTPAAAQVSWAWWPIAAMLVPAAVLALLLTA